MSLVAHWKLQDNAASTTVVATVGTDGVLTGAGNTSASTGTPGPGTLLTRYLSFDGTNDYVLCTSGNSAVLQNKSVATLFCRFKCSTTDTSGNHILLFVSNNSTAFARAAIRINTSGQIVALARAGDGESLQTKTTTSGYDDNAWHDVAVVFNFAADTITIYIDGVSVAQTGTPSFTGSATSNTASANISIASGSAGNEHYKGLLADPRIYDSDETANIATIGAEKDTPGGGSAVPVFAHHYRQMMRN